MITKGLTPGNGAKAFAIMEHAPVPAGWSSPDHSTTGHES
jgi:hypothetical protein